MEDIIIEIAKKLGADVAKIGYQYNEERKLSLAVFRVHIPAETFKDIAPMLGIRCFLLKNKEPLKNQRYLVAIVHTASKKLIVKHIYNFQSKSLEWQLENIQSPICIIARITNKAVSTRCADSLKESTTWFIFNDGHIDGALN